MRTAFRVLTLLGVCLSLTFGQADANKAQLSGTVTDPNQAVMPNVTVKIRNIGTGLVRELKTNDAGQYRAVLLDPGTYQLESEATGFAKSTFDGITLTVGASATLDIALSLKQTTTSIEVGASLLSLDTSSSSSTVNAEAIANLPINGRRFQDFAALAPTAQVDTATRGQISFAGQRGIYSNIMLDGADYNQPFFGGIRGGERSGTVLTVPQTAIQEFQVIPTGYSAEYGRSTGGIMNTITRSGTNNVHGEGFWQIRPREASADNPIFKVQPSETLKQYGGGIGGPIKANRMFYFIAAEGQNANTPRQVVLTALNGFTPAADQRAAFDYLKSLEAPFSQTNRAVAMTAKTDYQFAKGDRLTFRYNFSDSKEANAVSVGGAINPFTNGAVSNEGSELDRIHNGTMQFTKLISPSVVNDLRFTGSAEVRPRLANSAQPLLTAGPIAIVGTRSFLPTTQDDKRIQISDGLSLTRGRHTMKFGVDLNWLKAGQFFAFNQFGAFGFGTSDINVILRTLSADGTGGVNRFDHPQATYSKQLGNGIANFSVKQLAFFAQDSFKMNAHLSFDFGLRWEGQYNPKVEANNQPVIDRASVLFPIGSVTNVRSIPNAAAQIMPRFGFAYSPLTSGSTKLVVRGFTGLFYGATPMLSFAGPVNNFRTPPGDVSLGFGNIGGQLSIYQGFLRAGVDLNKTPLSSLPNISPEITARAAAFAANVDSRDPFFGASFTGMAADFRNPRAYQAGLGVESEILPGFTTGVQLHYVNTSNLMRNRNYNLPIPIVRPADLSQRPFFQGRPTTAINQLTMRESSSRAMYRAATLSAQYRKKKFQFQAFYTLAENFSNDDNERDAGGFVYENSFNLKPEYGYANMDIRSQFTSNGTYSLPWGLDLGGIFRMRSGLPYDARAGSDLNGDGNNNDRPYFSAGQPLQRNAFRNRGTKQTDLRVMKSIKIRESMRLQFSVELFNVFNADNVVFAGVNNIFGAGINTNGTQAPTDARFMRLRLADGSYDRNNTQVGNPTQAQFGVRFFF